MWQDNYSEGLIDGRDEVIDWFKSTNAAKSRGHRMTIWHQIRLESVPSKLLFRSTCINCGREIDIILNPAPNETNVSGSAVAVNCD